MITKTSICLVCRKNKPIAPAYTEKAPCCIECSQQLKNSSLGGKIVYADHFQSNIFLAYKELKAQK